MLHVALPSGNFYSFTAGHFLKPTKHCPAPCCDVACNQCSAEADCPHSSHGEGGFCVFTALEGEFVCVTYYPQIIGYADCICTEPLCDHMNHLESEAKKRLPGSRAAGTQKARFLAAKGASLAAIEHRLVEETK